MVKHELPGTDKFRLIIANWIHTFLCGALLVSLTACAASYRPVIINPELNQFLKEKPDDEFWYSYL